MAEQLGAGANEHYRARHSTPTSLYGPEGRLQRVVIVSGVCGAGKSEALRSMRQALSARVGEIAVLESDHFYTMIDPDWNASLPDAQWYYKVSGWLLRTTAQGFLHVGFNWVGIGSNGMWSKTHVREFVAPFTEDGVSVHHVTLDPGLDEAVRRAARRQVGRTVTSDARITPESIESELARFREHYGPWTHVIDNSALTPTETAVAIYEAVEAGVSVVS